MSDTPTTEATCRKCRAPFLAPIMKTNIPGKTEIRIQLRFDCPKCFDAAMTARETQEREENKKRAQFMTEDRETLWAAMCPLEFRSTTEGGRTDCERLQREQPLLSEIIKWNICPRGLILIGAT